MGSWEDPFKRIYNTSKTEPLDGFNQLELYLFYELIIGM